jgi:hypothetical protein
MALVTPTDPRKVMLALCADEAAMQSIVATFAAKGLPGAESIPAVLNDYIRIITELDNFVNSRVSSGEEASSLIGCGADVMVKIIQVAKQADTFKTRVGELELAKREAVENCRAQVTAAKQAAAKQTAALESQLKVSNERIAKLDTLLKNKAAAGQTSYREATQKCHLEAVATVLDEQVELINKLQSEITSHRLEFTRLQGPIQVCFFLCSGVVIPSAHIPPQSGYRG